MVTNGSVYFKAFRENGKAYLRLTDQNGAILTGSNGSPVLDNDSASISENDLSVSVKNEPGTVLPSTGGYGTDLIHVLGIMLTGLACTGLVMKIRRKNEV